MEHLIAAGRVAGFRKRGWGSWCLMPVMDCCRDRQTHLPRKERKGSLHSAPLYSPASVFIWVCYKLPRPSRGGATLPDHCTTWQFLLVLVLTQFSLVEHQDQSLTVLLCLQERTAAVWRFWGHQKRSPYSECEGGSLSLPFLYKCKHVAFTTEWLRQVQHY